MQTWVFVIWSGRTDGRRLGGALWCFHDEHMRKECASWGGAPPPSRGLLAGASCCSRLCDSADCFSLIYLFLIVISEGGRTRGAGRCASATWLHPVSVANMAAIGTFQSFSLSHQGRSVLTAGHMFMLLCIRC